MNLGFIILAHDQPASVRRLLDRLATEGNRVVVHFDKGATSSNLDLMQNIAKDYAGQVSIISKVHCVWGEWSLVAAVLMALEEFAKMVDPPDYIHLMSGADLPIRPLSDLKEFLRQNPGKDFIECCDITQKQWVKGGLGRERLRYYYPFNFRTSRKAFDRMVRWQRKLKVRRKMPLGLIPHMGSQWWTLRWSSCAKLLEFIYKHPQVPRFFRSTWIPDESFFQTVIAKLIPSSEIANLQLMFHHLGPSGRPYVFYNDHLSVIRRIPHFFIRKVSPLATDLQNGIFEKPRLIPKPKHLARVRDVLANHIDANHLLADLVPGHLPLRDPNKKRILQSPVLVCLVSGDQELQHIQTNVMNHSDYCWLGRPFAPDSVRMPTEALAKIGITEQSYRLRDSFILDFIYRITSCPPNLGMPVFGVVVADERNALRELGAFREVILLSVYDQKMPCHRKSIMAGDLEAAYPGLSSRVIYLEKSELGGALVELAADRDFHKVG